jgi:flagellar hook-associated protein 3 FlgL
MSTGKILDDGSDDAVLYSKVIDIESNLRTYEGLQTQIERTTAQNEVSDSSINEVKNTLDAMKVDLLKSLNSGMTRPDRVAVAKNMEGMRDNLYSLMNTQIDDEFIFSGSDTTIKSYEKDTDFKINGQVDFNGNGHLRNIAVEPNTYRERGVSAYDVLMYNTDTSANDGTITFTQQETVVDEYGNTWKLNDTKDKLVKYKEDGTVSQFVKADGSLADEFLAIKSVVHNPQEFQIKKEVREDDKFTIDITKNGSTDTIEYTAVAGDSAEDVARELAEQINNLSYMSATSDGEGNIEYTSTEKFNAELSTTSKTALFEWPEGTYTTETINDALVNENISSRTESGLLLETKHNLFDDLNIMINALYGYSTIQSDTAGNGRKDEVIDDESVRKILANSLEHMSDQFDATNIGHAELGGRNRIFVNALDTINSKVTHYNILMQETNGADMGKLAMESKALELTYNALYSTVSKMNQLSLVNFLK